ncbi:hypothetical protein JOC36_001450 [Weissella uvarum]|uniref:hypothetical protein n=1 Tax=Weissella uvarum TaxID=1479233 RepID=UPI00195F65C7|nr:hypothetical protein [Weissella uvarum]MBM7617857.1 hypothetical protein [Weissella uvarum]MCM0596145.1 hypothetical protein [Weissella uvarum]
MKWIKKRSKPIIITIVILIVCLVGFFMGVSNNAKKANNQVSEVSTENLNKVPDKQRKPAEEFITTTNQLIHKGNFGINSDAQFGLTYVKKEDAFVVTIPYDSQNTDISVEQQNKIMYKTAELFVDSWNSYSDGMPKYPTLIFADSENREIGHMKPNSERVKSELGGDQGE